MTQQQIDYWKLQESVRANQATEAENVRYHKKNEDLQSQINAETERHNRAGEAINRANLDIAARNAATNALNAETNRILAGLTAQRDAETARHNSALESIQSTYNNAIMQFNEKKLSTEVDIASADRSSREYIASQNILSNEKITGEKIASEEYIAELNVKQRVGGDVLDTAGSIIKAGAIGTVGAAAAKVVTGGLVTKTLATVLKPSVSKAMSTATSAASKAATTLGAGALIGPAVMGAGILYGMTLAYQDTKNPGSVGVPSYTKNLNPEDFQKGVKYYGAE